ncbi:MAG: hypothetical protein LBU58_06505 [Clostridiales bacterium]|jgi:hypothetical protein|nr:hypothetical protein [Clostridiales bacterium]
MPTQNTTQNITQKIDFTKSVVRDAAVARKAPELAELVLGGSAGGRIPKVIPMIGY